MTGRVTQDIYGQNSIPFRVSATEVINSSPVLLQGIAATNLAASSKETASSPPSQSEIQSLKATPSKEVIENYESDAEEVSSLSLFLFLHALYLRVLFRECIQL